MINFKLLSASLVTSALLSCADGNLANRDPAQVAARAIRAISASDWATLASVAHPTYGVRFSPYAYVDTTDQVVLSPAQIAALANDSQFRRWGIYDGSGDPIDLSVQDYFDRFVCDREYANAEPGPPNERIGSGNTLNNIGEAYAGRDIVFFEYYAPGTEEHAGMDWRSLRLVLERTKGRWYLIGVVHDEWTI